jgi:hypothetical protein
MTRQNLPTGGTCINSAQGKTSYVLLVARRGTFPSTLSVNTPVTDQNNSGLNFTASVVSASPNGKNATLKLVSNNTGGGAPPPSDGVLSITLIDTSGPTFIPVADVPVDYINDPSAPS